MSDVPGAPEPPPARQLFGRRMRRLNRWYWAVVGAVVVAGVVVSTVLIDTGEIAHVTLRSNPVAPTPLPTTVPAATVSPAWSQAESTALGAPYYAGVVVTYGTHSVSGRDARTGAVRWSLTRTDRTVCTAVQEAGTTLAIFAKGANCDELSQLATGTGQRINTGNPGGSTNQSERTLKDDGHPAYYATDSRLLTVTPSTLHEIRIGDGYDAWDDSAPAGCSYVSAVIGSAGVLDQQRCADGYYLELRDPDAGDNTVAPASKNKWRVRSTAVPLSADQLVSALDPATEKLEVLSTKGTVTRMLSLGIAPSLSGVGSAASGSIGNPVSGPVPLALNDAELIWFAGRTFAVSPDGTELVWSGGTLGPPTLVARTPSTVIQGLDGPELTLADAYVLARTTGGAIELNGSDARPVHTYPLAASDGPAAQQQVYGVGSGLLFTGTSTTVLM